MLDKTLKPRSTHGSLIRAEDWIVPRVNRVKHTPSIASRHLLLRRRDVASQCLEFVRVCGSRSPWTSSITRVYRPLVRGISRAGNARNDQRSRRTTFITEDTTGPRPLAHKGIIQTFQCYFMSYRSRQIY